MTALQILQAIAVLVAIAGSGFAVARVLFVTEVKVEAHDKRLDKVEGKADSVDKEVTGPHNMRAVKLAGDIANVDAKVDALVADFREFRNEYRADQKQKRS